MSTKFRLLLILLAALIGVVSLRPEVYRQLFSESDSGSGSGSESDSGSNNVVVPGSILVATMDAPLPRTHLGVPPRVPGSNVFHHPYQFSQDFFSWNVGVWQAVLAPFVGQPDVHHALHSDSHRSGGRVTSFGDGHGQSRALPAASDADG